MHLCLKSFGKSTQFRKTATVTVILLPAISKLNTEGTLLICFNTDLTNFVRMKLYGLV